MRAIRLLVHLYSVALCFALLSCGGSNNSSNTPPTSNPVPAVRSATPNSVSIGASNVTLTVVGSNFVQGSTVMWNGSALTTTFVSSTQSTASIPATALSGPPGNIPVTVTNPAPGGGTSGSVDVVLQSPQPSIASLSPNGVILGSGSFTLTVNGSNFVSGALVYWNGASRVTSFVNSTQLTTSIPASDLALTAATIASVTVQNPSPSAGISNVAVLNVESPVPVVSSIAPQSALAGGGAYINVNGSGFLNNATIQLAGQPVSTIYNGSTELVARIPTTLVGDVAVTVTNPAPNAGSSNALTLSLVAGGKGITLTPTSIDPKGNLVPVFIGFHGLLSSNARYFSFGNYLRDTCLGAPGGCTPVTISYADGSGFRQARWVGNPSPDGQYLASSLIDSSAAILKADIEFSNTCIGVSVCTPSTQVLTTQDYLVLGSTSATGRYISYKYGLSPPQAPSLNVSAYIYDTCIGAASGCNPAEIAIDPTNTSVLTVPYTSSDGRYAVYTQQGAPNREIVLGDTCLGAAQGCTPTAQVLSDTTKSCWSPVIGGDGQWVAYNCDVNGAWQVFLGNTCAGATSCTPSATQITSDGSAYAAGVSQGGRYVTYYGGSNTLAGYPLPGQMIYVYDSCNGVASGCAPQSAPVCLNAEGAVADADCIGGQISDDGKYININSQATNLISLPSGVTGASYVVPNPLQ